MRGRGFTLVEILVASVVMVFILVAVGGLLHNVVLMRATGTALAARSRLGAEILGMIRRDLDAMAFFPGRNSVYFTLSPGRDPTGNRRDTLCFDALVPYMSGNGVMVHRLARVTYTAEETYEGAAEKKLIRRVRFINAVYPVPLHGKREERGGEGLLPRRGEKSTAGKDDREEEEHEAVLARGVAFFRVDVPAEETREWREEEVLGRVPRAVRVSLGLRHGGEKGKEEEETRVLTFSSVFMPVLAPYVSNRYLPKKEAVPRRETHGRTARGGTL